MRRPENWEETADHNNTYIVKLRKIEGERSDTWLEIANWETGVLFVFIIRRNFNEIVENNPLFFFSSASVSEACRKIKGEIIPIVQVRNQDTFQGPPEG
jgi:hypothetical protein